MSSLRHSFQPSGCSSRSLRDIGCLAELDLVRPMQGVADRVLLGLLPSSQCAWRAALAALKNQGGWLHLHNNVKDSEEAAWSQATLVCLVLSNVILVTPTYARLTYAEPRLRIKTPFPYCRWCLWSDRIELDLRML